MSIFLNFDTQFVDVCFRNGIPIQQFPVAFDKANQKIRNRFNQSHLIISSNYNKEIELYKILDDINLLDNERIRPCWDTYFMVNSLFLLLNFH